MGFLRREEIGPSCIHCRKPVVPREPLKRGGDARTSYVQMRLVDGKQKWIKIGFVCDHCLDKRPA